MKVFISDNLIKPLSTEEACRIQFGQKMTKVIFRRLNELTAAATLETMRNIGRCHELKGVLAGCFALDLIHPQRLVFKPNNDKKDYLKDKTIAWSSVTSVEIIEIEDYH